MNQTPIMNEREEIRIGESELIDLVNDRNGNSSYEIDQIEYLKMLHESSPDPDSLSMISDFSEMGHEVKQSIRFSDMIVSTYSDLKNPNKSISVVPNTSTDPNMILRKYNMLSLALEFAKWKELNVDSCLGESIPDNGPRFVNESSLHDYPMVSNSPSQMSDRCSESQNCDLECISGDSDRTPCHEMGPLQQHMEETLHGDSSSSESEVEETPHKTISRMIRPAWAQSIFHRDTLMKMPKSIREATGLIRHFDLSKEKCLQMLDASQLQLIINSLVTQIEELNECLVATLITRDELRCQQTFTVIHVEEMTIKAKSMAQEIQLGRNDSYETVSRSQTYGTVHRFLSNFICSPKVASNRVMSFFTQTAVSKLPPPEYV